MDTDGGEVDEAMLPMVGQEEGEEGEEAEAGHLHDGESNPDPQDLQDPQPEEEEETYEYTEQQVREMRSAFKKYDTMQSDAIPLLHLGSVLRSLALNPTDKQLRAAAKWLDADLNTGLVRFKEFLVVMGRALKDPVTEEHVLEGFRRLDEQNEGVVARALLHDVLTMTGEQLSAAEFAALARYADPRNKGVVRYEEFVRKMNAGQISVGKGKGGRRRKKKKKGKKKKKVKKREAGYESDDDADTPPSSAEDRLSV